MSQVNPDRLEKLEIIEGPGFDIIKLFLEKLEIMTSEERAVMLKVIAYLADPPMRFKE
jgi:hypothetical protein